MNADLLSLILGNGGALVVLCAGYFWFWRVYQREADRVDKLDGISGQALTLSQQVLEQTRQALLNHAKIFENQDEIRELMLKDQQEIKILILKIVDEQAHAKERENWTK